MRMFRIYITLIALMLIASVVLLAPGANAQAQEPFRKLTIVVIDRSSISGDAEEAENVDLLHTLLGLLFQLKDGQPFAFVFTDDLKTLYGPMDMDAAAFSELREQIDDFIDKPVGSSHKRLDSVLAEAYNYLAGLAAPQGSSIYFVTARQEQISAADEIGSFAETFRLIKQAEWNVFDFTYPDTNPDLKSVLSNVSSETGGESFDLTIPDGLTAIADRLLRREGKGVLTQISERDLDGEAVFDVSVDVAPGTGEMNVLVFRENSDISLNQKKPDGFEPSEEDSTSSSISEMPNLVVWKLVDPMPGSWGIEIQGDEGKVSVSRYSTNRYSVVMQPFASIPLGDPVEIVVGVFDAGRIVPVADAEMTARITDPSGNSILYPLSDKGTEGDSVPQDGYFTAITPPVAEEGVYTVDIDLYWLKIEHTITTNSSFDARHFPSLSFTPEPVDIIEPGVRTKIGTLDVLVGDQPFSVAPDALGWTATGMDIQSDLIVDIIPQQYVASDRAITFDVYYTTDDETKATIVLKLEMEYAGRPFISETDSIVMSSVPPPVPMPTPRPAATATPMPPPEPPVIEPEDDITTVQIIITVAAILGALALVIIAILVYWISRPSPFGYLSTEDGEVLVSFSEFKRSTMNNLMKRNRILGEELPLPGFDNIEFVFARAHRMFVHSIAMSASTVRVDNQPVTDSMEVVDEGSIGAVGKLYVFTAERPE